MFLISAFVLGLAGSMHCVGMCGPIALALPMGNRKGIERVYGALLYNVGRGVTYAMLGAILGLLGAGIVLAGMHRWLSLILGILLILSVFVPHLFTYLSSKKANGFSFISRLQGKMRQLFAVSSYPALFSIGILNGFLPCGLVYAAAAAALAVGSVTQSALYMFVFGLGTLPVMFVTTLARQMISVSWRTRLQKIAPVVVVFIGVLFVLRGLDLGIPYISPSADNLHVPTPEQPAVHHCH